MRLAFVVPRYGEDVVGGAETLVRDYAERLAAAGHAVEVLTTCARDHFTWANELPAGETVVRGVRVRRFPVSRAKDHGLMTSLHARLDAGFPLDAAGERAWVENTGESAPLLEALEGTADGVDAVLFAPYLFATTCLGVGVRPERSLVIPCLHDEVYARFSFIQEALRSVAGLVFNTAAEQALAARLLGEMPPSRVVGVGFEAPARLDPEGFRRHHRLSDDLVTYAGRREQAKNFPLLLRWMTLHARAYRPQSHVRLVAMGSSRVDAPPAARGLVTDLGVVPEQTKLDAMAASVAVAQLSLNESFSYALMEGWLCGTPSIVHGGCAVTRAHCEASGGGLWVSSAEEFSEALGRLQDDAGLRRRLGEAGRAYVAGAYSWPAVLARLERAIEELI